MSLDLNIFKGKQRDEICRSLKDDGYEILRRSSLCTVFHQPDSPFAVHVSMTPTTTALICDAFQRNAQNPFLPKVYNHLAINHNTHISVLEKLASLEEIAEQDTAHVTFGIARAVSSFAYGDQIHEFVHNELAKNPQIIEAVRVLVGCARDALRTHGGNGDSLFVDRAVDGILFRIDDQGGVQPVLANTLRYTTPSQAQEMEFNNILERMRDLEDAQPHPPAVAPPGSPAPV